MSKDVDRVTQRACLGAHPSNIEEELAESSFGFLSYENIQSKGFFYGYNNLVWLNIVIQSAGGLLVAVVYIPL